MRNASKVLGIIGGVISVLLGLFLILTGATFFMKTSLWEPINNPTELIREVLPESRYITLAATLFVIWGIVSVIAAALGLIGGIIVKKKNVASGVMMIVAAVLSIFAYFNLISMTLFIIGGVFALKKEPQNAMQPDPSQYPRP
ncbi:MAG: DUF4064 domain-containing protein [Clostridiales bacterium]|nr:DUF4064 domain-containing protein [Clostridiales bacterium]